MKHRTPRSSWSYSFDANALTSEVCSESLTALLHDTHDLLPVVVESCSHPSGLPSLFAQPFAYGGGGLGNPDECPLQVCLAFQLGRDGMPPFASFCAPTACRASDLTSRDFAATLERNLLWHEAPHHHGRRATQSTSFQGHNTNATNNNSNATNTVIASTATTPAIPPSTPYSRNYATTSINSGDPFVPPSDYAREYVAVYQRIDELGRFLHAGWTCGEWTAPPWSSKPALLRGLWGLYLLGMGGLGVAGLVGSRTKSHTSPNDADQCDEEVDDGWDPCHTSDDGGSDLDPGTAAHRLNRNQRPWIELVTDPDAHVVQSGATNERDWEGTTCSETAPTSLLTPSSRGDEDDSVDEHFPEETSALVQPVDGKVLNPSSSSREEGTTSFLEAFDWRANYQKLLESPPPSVDCNTDPLHGIRVLSLLWIVLGHTAAITSSTGPGYSNPGDVLPPHGWAISLAGQLIFSSRLAVDTFLVVSGFLLVLVTERQRRREPRPVAAWPLWMVASRLVRIFPLYLAVLGLFIFVAPRYLGQGVFWYQWTSLLEPCQDYGWTNLLFVNNFYPTDTSTTATCFYHSWYLAVDVQLFGVGVALLALYRYSSRAGRAATLLLAWGLVALQAWLTYWRQWSLNTFDGAAVARYDVEAYAKPHVRAPSYLAGMYGAMVLLEPGSTSSGRWTSSSSSSSSLPSTLLVLLCCAILFFVTFATASGAYGRRPCLYSEWPHLDQCGSLWSPMATFLYTAFSRTLWVLAVATLVFLVCRPTRRLVSGTGNPSGSLVRSLAKLLSLPLWTLPSHLSFAAYLLHPVWLFVWQLGAHQKTAWSWTAFGVQYVALCATTGVTSLLLVLWVEVPCALLWKRVVSRRKPHPATTADRPSSKSLAELRGPRHSAPGPTTTYGAVKGV